MVGKLLANDLVDDGVTVVMIHVSASFSFPLSYIITCSIMHLAWLYAYRYDERCWVR